MYKLFLIGNNLLKSDTEHALLEKGYEILRFDSVRSSIHRLVEKPDVLIVDKEQGRTDYFREFIRAAHNIPTLVISKTRSFSGFASWLKNPFSYPVYDPTVKELLYFIGRISRESSRYIDNRNLKHSLALAEERIRLFEDINKTLTSTSEIEKILTAIMKKAKKATKAEAWSILLIDEETGELVFQKIEGKTKKRVQDFRLKMGEGIAGWVAQEGIPVVVPDVSVDKRFFHAVDIKSGFKTRTLMCVPIKSKGRTLGVLEMVNRKDGEPFTKDDLSLLTYIVGQAAPAIEMASLYQKMTELAITDDLTKLFNTRYLSRTIETELQRCDRYCTSVSLIFMDLDHFKQVNDSFGHLVGSKLLVEVGQLLIKSLRSLDIVARYGGDEFVIVLPQTTPSAANRIAQRIRISMEQNVFLKKEGYAIKLTASFGVASYPESSKTKEELIRLADEAMYRVKNTTRNNVYAII